jgi:integrase
MSSLRKHPRSKYWYAVIPTLLGGWTNRSTKTTDKELANKQAMDWQKTVELARAGRLVASQARKMITETYEEANGEKLEVTTIAAYWERWLLVKAKECAPNTMDRYHNAHKHLLKYLDTRSSMELVHLDKNLITEYRDATAKQTSKSTANNNLKILRGVLTDAFRDGLVTVNEAVKVKTLKRNRKERFKRLPFTMVQIRKVLKLGTLTQEWRGMTLMGLYTGQRLSDVSTARWGQFDMVTKVWSFTSQKTGKDMILPIHPVLFKHLVSVRPKHPVNDDAVFPRAAGKVERTGKVGQLSKEFHDILAKVGLVETQSSRNTGKGRDTKRMMSLLSFHSLRGTLTSILKESGASQGVAMDIIGHDTPSVSDHYTKISEAVKREWIGKMPDVTI